MRKQAPATVIKERIAREIVWAQTDIEERQEATRAAEAVYSLLLTGRLVEPPSADENALMDIVDGMDPPREA